MHTLFYSALIAILTLCCTACRATRQAEEVERSGFLGPEVELRPGSGKAPLWVFETPVGSLAGYTRLIIDPVQVWYGDAARRSGTSEEDCEQLARALHDALLDALSPDYEIVVEPGPGTLRLRAALTDADAARPLGNTITTFVPSLRRPAVLLGRFANVRVWTGAASVEGEVLDAITGERLMAAIDRRIGTKSPAGAWSKWSDARSAFEVWAQQVSDRMARLRSQE